MMQSRKQFVILGFFLLSGCIHTITATNEQWVSLNQETEFRPSDPSNLSMPKAQRLRDAQRRFLGEENEDGLVMDGDTFAESQNTYYSGYQQAWRMIGFYVDCNSNDDDHRRDRSLNEDEDGACIRYLIWGAYVDLDYAGGGIGEYQYWDPENETWDKSTCETHGNGRCAKMDCHLENTHWELLGLYKEQYYASEWFEQLFKHAGYCIWDEDTYEFMQENYDSWPEGCSETEFYSEDGSQLYLDMKPIENANMTLALYEDAKCSIEYTGSDMDIEAMLVEEEYLSAGDLDTWNEALGVWKYCQSCRASNLQYGNGDRAKKRRRLDEEDANDGYFTCEDDAGYENVNQCMKFSSQTEMEAASYRNLREAQRQGSLLEISIGGQDFGVHVATPVTALAAKKRLAKRKYVARRTLTISLQVFASGAFLLGLTILFLFLWDRHQEKKRSATKLSERLVDLGSATSGEDDSSVEETVEEELDCTSPEKCTAITLIEGEIPAHREDNAAVIEDTYSANNDDHAYEM